MSSVDVAAIVSELQELVGARLVKAYQPGKEEIRLRLHQKEKGSLDLILEAGRRIHLTKYRRQSPRMPSNFAMYTRKHLCGGRIARIEQLDFDRIVEITIERWDKKFRLIAELLPRGNLVITDEEGNIMLPLRRKSFATRELKVREKYERPPSRENPLVMSESDLKNLFISAQASQDKGAGAKANVDVVRVLASALSLGGLYAEEVCERAGIEKNKSADKLTETEIKAIHEAIQALLEPVRIWTGTGTGTGEADRTLLRAQIVLDDGKKVDVLPFDLNAYETSEKIFFATFNDAADEFFSMQIAEEVEEKARTEYEKGIGKYDHILNEQLDAVRKFEQKEAANIKKGELIYARYLEIERLLAEMEKEKAEKRRVVTLRLPDTDPDLSLEIDRSVSIHKNASAYYERAKIFRNKRERVKRAIEETKERIRAEKEKEIVVDAELMPEKKEPQTKRVKEEWYEKFRWFETSDGFLVIGGRDATTNEMLVKKYMDSTDLFCHAQTDGAPVLIAKTGGKSVSEAGLQEIAQFAVSYSALWKYGFYEGECYCVTGEQVSKSPPSGEYIKKGSFMVRGKRQYFKAALGLFIGIDIDIGISNEKKKNRLVVGPATESQKSMLTSFVELAPGGELEKNELAKEIVKFFVDSAKAEDSEREEEVERIVSYEKVLRYLPAGKSRVIKTVSCQKVTPGITK